MSLKRDEQTRSVTLGKSAFIVGCNSETDDSFQQQDGEEGSSGTLPAYPDVHGRPEAEGLSGEHRPRRRHQGLERRRAP